eukprot:TRINITY_DN1669_c6_g1_i1.p1 TRINITY_DN1669_c6_g1~~TRINITY_DN1669_c6_g1_i1.p1  ORF type:complete len:415 (+),score=141.54 TRINITY_DN1669_c6_g1_i1:62-1306(+)
MAGSAYHVDVGSDLFGTKHNVQLRFDRVPSVAELIAACESYFDTKARACRPAGYPDVPFRVETFQVFDEVIMRWVDLYSAEKQLQPGQQVWCFQPESIWHSDAQGVIPEAEQAHFTWTTPLGSPRRGRVAADAGVPPTLSEKLRSVFYQIDQGGKGYLVFDDLDTAFRRCDMQFNGTTAGRLFQDADRNRSNHITYDEWVNFAIQYPSVVDALFFRFRDMGPGLAQAPPAPAAQQERQQLLQQYHQESWQGQQQRERQSMEYDLARARQSAQQAMDRQRQAEQAAQAALQQKEAALQDAERAQQEYQAATRAAQETEARMQHAAAEQQAAAAAAAAAAQQQQQPQSPSYTHGALQPSQGYNQPSPQRDQALIDYENARRRADQLRMQKEEAEREERNAWDRLYYSPASPHYGPQ